MTLKVVEFTKPKWSSSLEYAGRKNYLFAGSHDAAQRAAVVYSLLGTCKLHGVNPQEWLTDVFERIPTHPARRVADLLPHHWQKARQADKDKAA